MTDSGVCGESLNTTGRNSDVVKKKTTDMNSCSTLHAHRFGGLLG
jgi:hypothetical protein